MKLLIAMLSCLALAAPAQGQVAPASTASPPPDFSNLFTAWSGVSRDSLRAEIERRAQPAPAGAAPVSAEQRRSQGRAVALGERVAEVVRAGDCAEGERMAREAGDFPLVAAVRDYCRSEAPR